MRCGSKGALGKTWDIEYFYCRPSLPVYQLCLYTRLLDNGIRISMDGRGRWLDNVFIERLWRSLKYENVYLNAYETGSEAREGIGRWISFYNQTRPHRRV